MARRRGAGRGPMGDGRAAGANRSAAGGAGPVPRFPSSAAWELPRAGRSRPPLPPALRPRTAPGPQGSSGAPSRHRHAPSAACAQPCANICVCLFKWTRLGSSHYPGTLRGAKLLYRGMILSRTGDIQEQPGCNPVPCAPTSLPTLTILWFESGGGSGLLPIKELLCISYDWRCSAWLQSEQEHYRELGWLGTSVEILSTAGKPICSELKEVTFAEPTSLALKLTQSKQGTSSLYTVKLAMTGQGGQWSPPLYSSVRCQVWNTSASCQHYMISAFSHLSEPGHLQGNNASSVCSRARWE